MQARKRVYSTRVGLLSPPPLSIRPLYLSAPSIYPPIGHLELGTAAADVLLFLQRLVDQFKERVSG